MASSHERQMQAELRGCPLLPERSRELGEARLAGETQPLVVRLAQPKPSQHGPDRLIESQDERLCQGFSPHSLKRALTDTTLHQTAARKLAAAVARLPPVTPRSPYVARSLSEPHVRKLDMGDTSPQAGLVGPWEGTEGEGEGEGEGSEETETETGQTEPEPEQLTPSPTLSVAAAVERRGEFEGRIQAFETQFKRRLQEFDDQGLRQRGAELSSRPALDQGRARRSRSSRSPPASERR